MKNKVIWNPVGIVMSVVCLPVAGVAGVLAVLSMTGSIQYRNEVFQAQSPVFPTTLFALFLLIWGGICVLSNWNVTITPTHLHTRCLLRRRSVLITTIKEVSIDPNIQRLTLVVTHTGGRLRIFPAPRRYHEILALLKRDAHTNEPNLAV